MVSRAVNKDDPYYRSLESQKETLAAFVPELARKPAKPVDAKTALTLACRRKRVIDEFGVQQPIDKSTESLIKAKSGAVASQGNLKIPEHWKRR